ncbi:MAG: HAD-IG family 5'-nucleotidase [Deltaproteobacteria bacterium]|nr:HAD-IG family 5'-nucleotidase [Deltaproteobacteria bacterium]
MISSKPKTGIPKQNRIFVNRSLNFGNIKLVGFDMDHTLAPYNKESFESLSFQKTLEKFIEAGYPQELSTFTYKHNFLIRGLMVDKERGNVLKVDSHKYVKDAYHGYKRLTKEERQTLYNQPGFNSQNFITVDTFFALSEVQLFVDLVQYNSDNPGRISKSFSEIYKDLRKFIDASHADGSIKNEVLRFPEKYLMKDKHLARTLVRLIDSGKRLFLLTNSQYAYTQSIMSYVLHQAHEDFDSWQDYWDYIIVGASKPGFFTGTQPFFEVQEHSGLLKVHSGSLTNAAFFGGNARLFESLTGFSGDEILYVGDHIYGDIIRSKGVLNWRTMLIIKELEEEIPKIENSLSYLQSMDEILEDKEALDEELQKIRSLKAATRRQLQRAYQTGDEKKIHNLETSDNRLEERLNNNKKLLKTMETRIKDLIEEREKMFHPIWGELMKVGLERSRFAHQVCNYACLYSSGVSNLRYYSPYKKFTSLLEKLPHEMHGK